MTREKNYKIPQISLDIGHHYGFHHHIMVMESNIHRTLIDIFLLDPTGPGTAITIYIYTGFRGPGHRILSRRPLRTDSSIEQLSSRTLF